MVIKCGGTIGSEFNLVDSGTVVNVFKVVVFDVVAMYLKLCCRISSHTPDQIIAPPSVSAASHVLDSI